MAPLPFSRPDAPATDAPLTLALAIRADHPAFAGHFPGQPILPGVVLLDEVIAAVESTFCDVAGAITVKTTKFHATVSPGTPLSLRLTVLQTLPDATPSAIDFTIMATGSHRVASGRLDFAAHA
jgi:3-hydroxyacyl-[acyl-carrier-protein] dehydratase